MELIALFRSYLLGLERRPSDLTIKNYLSDVRKFISWYENEFQRPFTAQSISPQILELFKKAKLGTNHISPETSEEYPSAFSSANSVERYLSSLRKFFHFLTVSGLCSNNPFEALIQPQKKEPVDIWRLKSFKNYLHQLSASPLTIKNYMMDVNQFTEWFSQIAGEQHSLRTSTGSVFTFVRPQHIEEYKYRLLHDLRLSPISINRKLSSLRKYLTWASEQGLLQSQIYISNVIDTTQNISDSQNQSLAKLLPESEIDENPVVPVDPEKLLSEAKKKKYSVIPPIRLVQKILVGSNLLLDMALILPLTKTMHELQFRLWLLTGRKVFDTAAANLPEAAKSIIQDNQLRNVLEVGKQKSRVLDFLTPNYPKSFYAPLSIAIDHLPFHRRLIHHARHTRPSWYKTYHAHTLTHYLHFAILIAIMSYTGYSLYMHMNPKAQSQSAVLAASTSPPRVLSFQGRIFDNADNPITAETNLRFGIYNSRAASGSALLWQEVQKVQPEADGRFSVLLGSQVILPPDVFTDNTELFVGVTIGQERELDPRQQIPTVSYASNSDLLQGMSPITQKDAGTRNVLLALDSSGNLTIGGSSNPTFQATGGEFTLSGNILHLTTNSGSNSDIVISPDGFGRIDLQKMLHNSSNNNTIQSAAGAVEVDDLFAVLATSSGQSAFTINQNGTGPIISASGSGTAKFILHSDGTALFSGNLGVGVTNPHGSLTIGSHQGTEILFSGNERANIYQEQPGAQLAINSNTGDLILGANGSGSQHLTIKANGNVGVGSLNPTDFRLQVAGNVGPNGDLTHDLGSANFRWNRLYSNDVWANQITLGGVSTEAANIRFSGVGGNSFIASGNFGIGTTNPTGSKLVVKGLPTGSADAVHVDGNGNFFRFTSSSRYKTNITELHEDFSKILAVTPVSFTYKDSGISDIGYIAEDFHAAGLSPLVTYDTEGRPNGVKYDRVTLFAVEILKNHESRLSNLESLSKNVESYNKLSENINIDSNGTFLVNESADDTFTVTSPDGEVKGAIGFGKGFFGTLTAGVTTTKDLLVTGSGHFTQGVKASAVNAGIITVDTIIIAGDTLDEYLTVAIQNILREQTTALTSPVARVNNLAVNIISPLSEEAIEINAPTIINGNDEKPALEVRGSASVSGQLSASDLQADEASIAGTLRAKKLIADDIDLSDEALKRLGDRLRSEQSTSSANTNSNNTTQNGSNTMPTPTPTASITPSPLEGDGPNDTLIQTDYIDGASLSAMLAYVPSLKADFATFTEGLMSFGPASLGDVSVAGQFSVGGSLIIADNSMNVLGADLEIQPLRQGNVRFMSGLVAIDTEGNFSVAGNATFAKNVSIKGALAAILIKPFSNEDLVIQLQNGETLSDGTRRRESKFVIQDATGAARLSINSFGDLIASGSGVFKDLLAGNVKVARTIQADTSLTETIASSSAGTAVISKLKTERTIISPFVNEDSLIYITPVSDTQGVTPFIARQTAENKEGGIKGSFTIAIPKAITKDIKLNWWIVN